jgi:hypothetical protein
MLNNWMILDGLADCEQPTRAPRTASVALLSGMRTQGVLLVNHETGNGGPSDGSMVEVLEVGDRLCDTEIAQGLNS